MTVLVVCFCTNLQHIYAEILVHTTWLLQWNLLGLSVISVWNKTSTFLKLFSAKSSQISQCLKDVYVKPIHSRASKYGQLSMTWLCALHTNCQPQAVWQIRCIIENGNSVTHNCWHSRCKIHPDRTKVVWFLGAKDWKPTEIHGRRHSVYWTLLRSSYHHQEKEAHHAHKGCCLIAWHTCPHWITLSRTCCMCWGIPHTAGSVMMCLANSGWC